MSVLPDNRPITSLQIVENCEKCSKQYTPISRTYDQHVDADLGRDMNAIFIRPTPRYLCLSKTRNANNSVVESLLVIGEKAVLPKDFCFIARTADTQRKAWRKWQLVYKLAEQSSVTEAITDIILCSKLKTAPTGFKMAGYINGILICYKTSNISMCTPLVMTNGIYPSIKDEKNPSTTSISSTRTNDVDRLLNHLHVNGVTDKQTSNRKKDAGRGKQDTERMQLSKKLRSPQRPAPKPPAPEKVNTATSTSGHSISTLGAYTELDGVPFILNPALRKTQIEQFANLPDLSNFAIDPTLDYDFQLERQTLCTIKSPSSKNPFFK